MMDYRSFYKQIYAPLEATHGQIDTNTIVAIIGFDAGGPLNFCTIGRDVGSSIVTYVSCELAVRDEQLPNDNGRYELLASCDQEDWVRSILSNIGRMSLETVFNDGDTMDIGGWVNDGWFKPKPPLQGVLFKTEATSTVNGQLFSVLRCIGITRSEMEHAQSYGAQSLISLLERNGIYPHTIVSRRSVA